MELFQIRGLNFAYPDQDRWAVQDLTLDIKAGEFLILCGPSGCGKSTLLRQLKPSLTPHGQQQGEILFCGSPLSELDLRSQAQRIGFVMQSPDDQIVTDKVWHELAFGLESLGCDTPSIRRRVAEMASFFGIEGWFYQDVTALSGGQKQLLNLACAMVLQPDVLILDEPTSQLDPIAASDFLAMLGRINRELGTTVVLSEHRLEEAFPLADTVAVMDGGRLLCRGTPAQVGAILKESRHTMFPAMPTAMQVWAAVQTCADCPVTIRDGRTWLAAHAAEHSLQPLPQPFVPPHGETVLQAQELWFRYEKDTPDVVKGLSLTVGRGEFLALLGGNGAGKTTALRLLAGVHKPQRGTVQTHGAVGMLPQDPRSLFVKKTVREDLLEMTAGKQTDHWCEVVRLCRLQALLERHPFDLSGGEQQRAALAKLLLLSPDILLLDEPTKGLDASFKQELAEILQALVRQGAAIVMISHDAEFCAQYAHRCALFFDGDLVTCAPPREFFCGNRFYTTGANRMGRDTVPEAVTASDLIAVCGGSLPAPAETPQEQPIPTAPEQQAKLPLWRKLLAAVFGAAAVGILLFFLHGTQLSDMITAQGSVLLSHGQILLYLLFGVCLLGFAVCVARKNKKTVFLTASKSTLSGRTLACLAAIVLLVPATLFLGQTYLGGRKYLLISLLIALEVLLPFFLSFERRRPQARQLVLIAVLCAMNTAGRAAFFMLPEFKPVWALTIVVGIAFGGETGFLTGAMTMLVSNVLFGQGPWTPWQMAAMGLVGLFAGLLFPKGLPRGGKLSMCIYGAISCIVIYGGIMNTASALLWAGDVNRQLLAAYFVSGFPVDCVHAVATFCFLWLAGEPMLEKLQRIRTKYGIGTS